MTVPPAWYITSLDKLTTQLTLKLLTRKLMMIFGTISVKVFCRRQPMIPPTAENNKAIYLVIGTFDAP